MTLQDLTQQSSSVHRENRTIRQGGVNDAISNILLESLNGSKLSLNLVNLQKYTFLVVQ